MNEDLIKKLEELGFKEYKPSSLEGYDRAWQLSAQGKNGFINVNWYDLSGQVPEQAIVGKLPEVVHYIDFGKYAKSTKYYSFHNSEDLLELIQEIVSKFPRAYEQVKEIENFDPDITTN